jgi:hypothetical protein
MQDYGPAADGPLQKSGIWHCYTLLYGELPDHILHFSQGAHTLGQKGIWLRHDDA